MEKFSPKIEIINHFDSLINRVDIHFEEQLKKYDTQILGEKARTDINESNEYALTFFDGSYESWLKNKYREDYQLWSESTKVVDYLSQVRMRIVNELTKAMEDCIEDYKSNKSSIFSSQVADRDKNFEEMKSQLFANKYYFQVAYNKPSDQSWFFDLFTVVVDFYMSPSDIDELEIMINDIDPFEITHKQNFDEKMVLIYLIYELFERNFYDRKFPDHVIYVSKQDAVNIREISTQYSMTKINLTCSSIDLSKLESLCILSLKEPDEANFEGLSSLKYLHFGFTSLEACSFKNLSSLKSVHLRLKSPINFDIQAKLFDYMPNIEELNLDGKFGNINLDNLYNLKILSLSGSLNDNFNFNLFKNICNQLESLDIQYDLNNEIMFKLLNGHNFTNLKSLNISDSKITRIEKKLFEGFPMLETLRLFENRQVKIIDHDSFSGLKKLVHLSIPSNGNATIEQEHFLGLDNLQELFLGYDRISSKDGTFSSLKNLRKLCFYQIRFSNLNPQVFIDLGNLKELELIDCGLTYFDLSILDNIPQIEKIDLSENNITNKGEILNRFRDSKITFKF